MELRVNRRQLVFKLSQSAFQLVHSLLSVCAGFYKKSVDSKRKEAIFIDA